jgi:hypothetical protein
MSEKEKASKVAHAFNEVAATLGELESLFAPHCKLTFLMRDPSNDECSMLVTNDDDMPAVRRVMELLEKKEATHGRTGPCDR